MNRNNNLTIALKGLSMSMLISLPILSHVAQASSFSLGAGALIEQTAYRDYDRQIYPMPIINYQNQYVFVKGPSAGVYAFNTESDQLYFNIAYLPGQFKTSRTDNAALKQLDNRKLSFMAGVGYSHHAKWGSLYANIMTDISGKSHGTLAELAYGYSFQFDKFYIEPKIGVEWQNHKYNDYYFGVSRSESSRSGLNYYSANSGTTPYVAVNAFYNFNQNWQAFVLARYSRVSHAVKDSPMTSRSATGLIGTGIMYRF